MEPGGNCAQLMARIRRRNTAAHASGHTRQRPDRHPSHPPMPPLSKPRPLIIASVGAMRESGGHSALKNNTREAANTIGPSAPATKPTTTAVAITNGYFIAMSPKPNGGDQWPAAHGLATTHDDDRAHCIALFWAGSTRQSACHPATARFYRHPGEAGHRRWLAVPAMNHRTTPSRGIEPSATAGTATPQAAGCRINSPEASRNLAAERAQTVWAAPQTPSTIPRTRRRWPDCISIRPITHAASDRAGSELVILRTRIAGERGLLFGKDCGAGFCQGAQRPRVVANRRHPRWTLCSLSAG